MMRLMRWLLLLALGACTLDEVDLSDRHCPCAEGWTCDESQDLCVRDDAPLPDAGRDAPVDAPRDSGSDVPVDVPVDVFVPDSRSDVGLDVPDTGAPSRCDELDTIFCDGFEDGLSAWTSVREVGGAAQSTDEPPIYRGFGAFLGETTDVSGRASVGASFDVRGSGSVIYARAYVFVEEREGSVSMLYLGEEEAPFVGIAVQIGDDGRAQVYNGVTDTLVAGVRPEFTYNEWVCVTLEIDLADEGRVYAAIDGEVVAEETSIPTVPASGVSRLLVGVEFSSGATSGASVRVDEVAVAESPIPCDASF